MRDHPRDRPRQHGHIVTYHGGRLLGYYCSRCVASKAVHLRACWKSVHRSDTVCAIPSSAPGRWSTCNFSSGDSVSPPSRRRDDCPCRSPNLKRQAATRRGELSWGNAKHGPVTNPQHFKTHKRYRCMTLVAGVTREREKTGSSVDPSDGKQALGGLEKEEKKRTSLLELCFLPWSSFNLYLSPGLDMVRPIEWFFFNWWKDEIALLSPFTLHDLAWRILPPFRREPTHIVCLWSVASVSPTIHR